MTIRVQRLASLRCLAPRSSLGLGLAALALVLAASGSSCSPRALLEVDVDADTPFQGVTLRLSAGGTSKDFANVSFTAAMPYKAGLYADSTGTVQIVARALDSSGQCIGAGTASVGGVVAGMVSSETKLTVLHTTNCNVTGTAGTSGGAGGSSGGGGAGGSDNGTGGNGNGAGGSGNGSGGSNGSGGMTGAGGSNGGTNLVTNGDFSNGSNGWALQMIVGTVNQNITNGQFCATLGPGSVTIGYPSNGILPFAIIGGTPYAFSYQASSTGNIMIEAKVGQTEMPYDATGSDWTNEQVGQTLQLITHSFTRPSTDSMMGVAFNLSGGPGTFCLDNVSITTN